MTADPVPRYRFVATQRNELNGGARDSAKHAGFPAQRNGPRTSLWTSVPVCLCASVVNLIPTRRRIDVPRLAVMARSGRAMTNRAAESQRQHGLLLRLQG